MRSYWAIITARFRMLLQYRMAAAAGFGTQLFWGLMRVMIFTAFYHSTTKAQPMSLEQVITYVWLGQAMLAMLPWNVDVEIRQMIRTGTVAYELVKPVDLYWFWFSRAVAMRTAPTILRAAPMFVVAMLFFDMQSPPSWASAGAWALSMCAALLLACALTTLLTMSMLWTISGEGIARFLMIGVMVFSGMIVPLPLFPDWAQSVLNFMPFRGIADIPYRLYTGHIPPDRVLWVVGHQLIWTLAIVIIGRWLLSLGTRKLVVQGG
jgi:ABC-2 type transport system permease protein